MSHLSDKVLLLNGVLDPIDFTVKIFSQILKYIWVVIGIQCAILSSTNPVDFVVHFPEVRIPEHILFDV